MGSANSSNQENMEENSDTGDSSNSEQEPDIVSILQYLIRNNAEIGILSTNEMEKFSDDSEDESNCDMQSDLDQSESVNKIEGSEFEQDTLLKSGAVRKSGFNRPNNLTKMVNQREMGMYGSQQFTKGDCCLVSAGFLPNTSRVIHNYHNKVFCGTYSQDGRLFLTACQDRCLRLYNCESRNIKLFKTVEARDVGWSVLDTAFSPDGNHFVYSSWSECIHLCSIYGRNEFHHSLPLNPEARRFCIFSLMFSQDGSEVLGGANDGCLYVYDIDRARRTLKIQSHDDDVNTVAFADDTSQILFSGGDDGICRVWDRRTLDESHPKPVGVLAGHRDGITFIDSRNDGRHLITNCKDQSIKLWDMRVFSPSEGLENTKRAVSSYVWDYRWQSVPRKFSSLNKTSKRLSGDTSLMTYMGHKVLQTLIRCRFSPAFTTGQRYIYTGCSSGKVIIYDALTGTKVKELKNHRSCVRDVSWHPFKSEIVSTSWDSTIVHWTYEEDLCDDPDIETIVSDVTNRKTQNPLRKRKTYNLRPRNTSSCSWPQIEGQHQSHISRSATPLKIVMVADTHLLGQVRGHWFDKLRREWQMHRSFQSMMIMFDPKVVFFLGDLFDEGLIADDATFNYYVHRFHSLFAVHEETKVYVVVGNHDIGFHYSIRPKLNERFISAFNAPAVQFLNIEGNTFVLINSMAMEGDGCSLCRTAEKQIRNISAALKCQRARSKNDSTKDCPQYDSFISANARPVLLQHFPMYRPSDGLCDGPDVAPSKDKNIAFRQRWECLSESASNLLLKLLEPRLIFGGHTHHGCFVLHNATVPEWSVPSFSWRNRNNPSFLLVTLTPEEYAVSKCFLPQESTVQILYILTAVLPLLWIVCRKYYRFHTKYQ